MTDKELREEYKTLYVTKKDDVVGLYEMDLINFTKSHAKQAVAEFAERVLLKPSDFNCEHIKTPLLNSEMVYCHAYRKLNEKVAEELKKAQ